MPGAPLRFQLLPGFIERARGVWAWDSSASHNAFHLVQQQQPPWRKVLQVGRPGVHPAGEPDKDLLNNSEGGSDVRAHVRARPAPARGNT